MHYRRIICLLLGFWLGGSLFMLTVATHNFAGVDILLRGPSAPAAKQIQVLGANEARTLLRYQVSELNRWYFENWERVQIGLGVAILLVFVFGAGAKPFAMITASAMLLIVLMQRFLLTPEIVRLGRAIDFVGTSSPSVDRAHFWNFHTAYSTIEVLKLVLGFLLTARLVFRRRRRASEFPDEIDLIDNADNGHVDGR